MQANRVGLSILEIGKGKETLESSFWRMVMEDEIVPKPGPNGDELEKDMEESLAKGFGPKVARLALAIVGGAIPFGGGVFSGAAGCMVGSGTRPLQPGCAKLDATTKG